MCFVGSVKGPKKGNTPQGAANPPPQNLQNNSQLSKLSAESADCGTNSWGDIKKKLKPGNRLQEKVPKKTQWPTDVNPTGAHRQERRDEGNPGGWGRRRAKGGWVVPTGNGGNAKDQKKKKLTEAPWSHRAGNGGKRGGGQGVPVEHCFGNCPDGMLPKTP